MHQRDGATPPTKFHIGTRPIASPGPGRSKFAVRNPTPLASEILELFSNHRLKTAKYAIPVQMKSGTIERS